MEDTVDFLHYFMLYLLWTDEKEEADEWVKLAIFLMNKWLLVILMKRLS